MAVRIAAIADDYTGASDLANTWRRNGLRTIQTIDLPDNLDTADADAIVVSFKIRSVPAEDAVAAATKAYKWLREIGVAHVMYKVCSTFDSTDLGNIGQVTDALRKLSNADWSMVTPAFPATKRTVYKGHLFVEDVLLNESPLKHHPLNPMLDPNLVRVLQMQSNDKVGLLDISQVHAGDDAAFSKIEELVKDGKRSIIADSISEGDLEIVGRLAARSPVSTGASGLGLGLARAIGPAEGSRNPPSKTEALEGHSAILAGSCSARTLEQVAEAEKTMPVLRLDADKLIESGGDISEALSWALERLSDGPVLIAVGSDSTDVQKVQAKHGSKTASHVIETSMGRLAAKLVEKHVSRLVVAGGETSGAVVDHLGISGFLIGEEIDPGVPALRTIGRSGGDLSMALKSGNFGAVDFFARALSRL